MRVAVVLPQPAKPNTQNKVAATQAT